MINTVEGSHSRQSRKHVYIRSLQHQEHCRLDLSLALTASLTTCLYSNLRFKYQESSLTQRTTISLLHAKKTGNDGQHALHLNSRLRHRLRRRCGSGPGDGSLPNPSDRGDDDDGFFSADGSFPNRSDRGHYDDNFSADGVRPNRSDRDDDAFLAANVWNQPGRADLLDPASRAGLPNHPSQPDLLNSSGRASLQCPPGGAVNVSRSADLYRAPGAPHRRA